MSNERGWAFMICLREGGRSFASHAETRYGRERVNSNRRVHGPHVRRRLRSPQRPCTAGTVRRHEGPDPGQRRRWKHGPLRLHSHGVGPAGPDAGPELTARAHRALRGNPRSARAGCAITREKCERRASRNSCSYAAKLCCATWRLCCTVGVTRLLEAPSQDTNATLRHRDNTDTNRIDLPFRSRSIPGPPVRQCQPGSRHCPDRSKGVETISSQRRPASRRCGFLISSGINLRDFPGLERLIASRDPEKHATRDSRGPGP